MTKEVEGGSTGNHHFLESGEVKEARPNSLGVKELDEAETKRSDLNVDAFGKAKTKQSWRPKDIGETVNQPRPSGIIGGAGELARSDGTFKGAMKGLSQGYRQGSPNSDRLWNAT